MGRWVILRHTLPDGSCHLDWLLEPPPGASVDNPARPLISFRVPAHGGRPDHAGIDRFPAERIGGHRLEYLDYEGPVSGGRGRVDRASAGDCTIHADGSRFVVELHCPGESTVWIGTRQGSGSSLYTFHLSEGRCFGHTGGEAMK